ncbi:uncharacterized protein SPAPADRAFT_130726 [Spathaspora passalidarum NRRL Y-27907]|uniref:CWH43-like N-terminal domain-containing protein n=1 Tax=Spathaspora passalidarum (strain NRRL Y-27907 / 11-Y1) TaxID=619300 RepID=G3AGM6_SPAPN|nr:uncharacterized protein SPAPADRAFT_130726 [Spathaspora passalidarum NRRL Y-27907]EGW35365.1 hypothetical protein SPAPADRAFT_130726 [Spathaspora passalidarum NRRL Y-27907]
MKTNRVRFTIIHWYLLPLVSLVVWWGMLIALLACWGAQGRPIYSFMTKYQNPVYISSIAATNLQPLFIACSGFQAIFFVCTLVVAYYLRTHGKIQSYISKVQQRFAIVSMVFATIGQLGILFTSIFNTSAFPKVHISFVGIFIICVFLACVFDFLISFMFGTHPDKLDPHHDFVIFGHHKWSNLYMVAFGLKVVWVATAVALAVCFGYYMRIGHKSRSAIFEWVIAFWYGLLLIMWSMDLLSSAIRSYERKHNTEFDKTEITCSGSNDSTFV